MLRAACIFIPERRYCLFDILSDFCTGTLIYALSPKMRSLKVGELRAYYHPQELYPVDNYAPFDVNGTTYTTFREAMEQHDNPTCSRKKS